MWVLQNRLSLEMRNQWDGLISVLTCQLKVYSWDTQRAITIGNWICDLEAPERGLVWTCREFQPVGSSYSHKKIGIKQESVLVKWQGIYSIKKKQVFKEWIFSNNKKHTTWVIIGKDLEELYLFFLCLEWLLIVGKDQIYKRRSVTMETRYAINIKWAISTRKDN